MAIDKITTPAVTDDSVTLAKMAPGTDGNIISYDASGNPVAVATGNDGQVLTSTGAGSPPAFETPASGSNLPAFLATASTQTPSSATQTLVDFNNVTFDTASGYNTSAKKYVIPSAGYYFIYANVDLYNANNDLDRVIAYIYQNTGIKAQSDTQALNAAGESVYQGVVINCSANDEITVKVYQVSGSGAGTIADDKTYFGGYKLIS